MVSLTALTFAGAADAQTVCTPDVGAYACAGGGLDGLGAWSYTAVGAPGVNAWVLTSAGVTYANVCFATGGPGFSCVQLL